MWGFYLSMHYDYIICGGGMAGLSLAYYLQNSKLADKRVLIIEPEEKNTNDRTWAMWEQTPNAFEHILCKSWNAVQLVDANGVAQTLDMGGYKYKLLRGIDFYAFVTTELKKNANISWLKGKVKHIHEEVEGASVETQNGELLQAEYVFDSTYKLDLSQKFNHNLLQHFKGYVIETTQPGFDVALPTMMDFSVPQKNDCRFMYLLPFSERRALVEYTLFSETLLTPEEYDAELKQYIEGHLKLTDYKIIEEEFGIIPMSDVATEEFPSAHVVRIGTAGGYTNPATGYTFQNTQRRLKKLVENLEKTGSPIVKEGWYQKRFLFYASVLLNVLEQKRHSAADFFASLYRKNPPARVFSFLDGDTNLWEDIKLMNTVPKAKFIAAVGAVLLRKLKARFIYQPRP